MLIYEFFRFDTDTRRWQSLQQMPVALYEYDAVEINGKIFVASGNDLYCYEPDNDSWAVKSKNATTMNVPWFAKYKEYLYAIESNWNVHRYDTNQDTWTTVI